MTSRQHLTIFLKFDMLITWSILVKAKEKKYSWVTRVDHDMMWAWASVAKICALKKIVE